MSTITENVLLARERIARAAREAGRDPGEVRLLAATKMNDAERVREAVAAAATFAGAASSPSAIVWTDADISLTKVRPLPLPAATTL